MTTEVLGNLSFLDVPTVNGLDVLLNAGGTPSIRSDITANLPTPGTVGRLFIDTTANVLYRDTGSSWSAIGAPTLYTGTTNQIDVIGTVISLVSNPIIPGIASMRIPAGATADRPASPSPGDIRYNTSTGFKETYNGSYWAPAGTILQVLTGQIPATTTTSQIQFDNTTPLITEGSQIWSQTFTPISPSSRILVEYCLTVACSTVARTITTSLFSDTTIVAASSQIIPTGATTQNLPHSLALRYVQQGTSITPITFSARCGASGTGTTSVNSTSSGTLGGTLVSYYTITEIA